MTDYDELTRKAREATPGPWWRQGNLDVGPLRAETYEVDGADAAYIAAASPDVILALLEFSSRSTFRSSSTDRTRVVSMIRLRAALQAEPAREGSGT